MFGAGKQNGVNGAGPLPPVHRSHAQRLAEPTLSRWTPTPTSLPPRPVSNLQQAGARAPAQVPTVPPRSNNSDTDNWVDLEELYRWLQELEDTKIESCSGDENHGKLVPTDLYAFPT
jgi:hypothetical protein